MRSGHTSYLSYESALAEFGSISQVPAVYIVATTGNSGQYQTPYGDIEFTHTSRSEVEISPDNTSRKVKRWAGEVARALEESQAMVVLLTPAAASSLDIKRNIEYALGAKNYSNRLIPVVVGDLERFPANELPWIVRRMPWFELDDTEPPRVEPIAEAILSHT